MNMMNLRVSIFLFFFKHVMSLYLIVLVWPWPEGSLRTCIMLK